MEIVRAIRYSDRATMQDILHKIIRRTTTRRAYLLEDLVARAAAAALVQVQGAGRPLQARQARYLLRPLVGLGLELRLAVGMVNVALFSASPAPLLAPLWHL